jgi:hypothetical protein
MVASGVSLALGVTLFVVTVGQALRRGAAPHTAPEAWMWMGLMWALVATGLQLAIVTLMAFKNLPVAPPFLDVAFVQAALSGFIGNFILGITLRAVPAFMALPSSHMKLVWGALVTINFGLSLTVLGALSGFTPWIMATAPIVELLGLLAFVIAIRLYSRRSRPRRYTLGAYGRYEWYLRAAYGWLLVSGVIQSWNGLSNVWPAGGLPMNLAGPALHALALGFVTLVIMGMAARMLPLFEGAILPLHWLMDVTFALLNISVLLRIAFGIIPSPAVWTGLALSGSLSTLALVCFTVVVWRTLHSSSRERYAEMARNLGQQHLVTVQGRGSSLQSTPPI